jgi:predicted Rossmann fold flavoprotein
MNQVVERRVYDVIVVGGGPAGMMAAGTAAARGLSVLLLEKNPGLGKKLLITGGGRCNITNAEPDKRKLLAHYKESDKFLFSAFSQYGVADTLHFFNTRGLATKVEDLNRVFPITDKAKSVWDVLVDYLHEGRVTIKTSVTVSRLLTDDDRVVGVEIEGDTTPYTATSYIIATGGKSRPETGSTGDGFRWLALLGHTIIAPDPSLVPIAIKEDWVPLLAGVTLPEVTCQVFQSDKRQFSRTGRLLFTHVGVSGPMILNLSKAVGELLEYGPVTLALDLFPHDDEGDLDALLISHLHTHSNKLFKNTLPEIVPRSLASVLLTLLPIHNETPCHSITKEERLALRKLLKALPLTVTHLLSTDKAIVTSGGIKLEEVNFKTMQSRKYPNLFLTGDLLNIDRPSGGFSLQLCWTTGYVAGSSVPITK